MISRLSLRPDLDECVLEDRLLLYAGPGLYASQFIPTAGSTPSFVVSGFQQSNSSPGSTGSTSPGPQFFFISVGLNSLANGGVRAGGTSAVFQPPQALPTLQGATIGSIPGATGSSSSSGGVSSAAGGGGGGSSTTVGYGGAISSGYNTSLNSSNNFGMGTTAVGSIAAHVSGTSDQLTETQAASASTTSPSTGQENAGDPNAPPSNPAPGLFSPQDRLLGKGLGSSNGLLIGPGMSNNPSSMSSPR